MNEHHSDDHDIDPTPDADDGTPRRRTPAGRRVAPWMAVGLLAAASLFLASCDIFSSDSDSRVIETDFTATAGSWTPAFSDYSAGMEEGMELRSGRRELPSNVDSSTVQADSAMYLAGSNHSDDLFMYLKRPVEGLAENTDYRVEYTVEIATAAPSGCVGIGGPPGEAVWMKGGAASVEPERQETDGYLNVAKGNQSTGGPNAVVLGNIANELSDCTGQGVFTRKELRSSGAEPLTVQSSGQGRLWLFVGTESGFEGRTGLYYLRIRAELEPVQG